MVLSPCGKITSFLCYGHMNRNWNYFQTPNYYDTKHWTSGQVLVSNISWSLRLSVVWFLWNYIPFVVWSLSSLFLGPRFFCCSFLFWLVKGRELIDRGWVLLYLLLLFFWSLCKFNHVSLIKMWVDCAQLPSSDFVVILCSCSGSQWSASTQL